ncbi:hypothetical protein SESBI_15679 [Sesbania bispinosa]|nr:hypothetical protein SESBI_15679 [Sesbania bispinosa]
MVSSARVSSKPSGNELSTQEEDLLDRSTKKPKVVEEVVQDKEARENAQGVQQEGGSLFQTTIGLNLERKTISYKDICLGVNGHNVSEEDVFFFECVNQDMNNGEAPANQEHDQGFLGDPLCLVAGSMPFRDELRRVSVWIRVPGLPIEFYDKRVLWHIGNVLGNTVKIDANTLREKGDSSGDFATERAKFARICIEVDLNKVLISKFSLDGRVYSVEAKCRITSTKDDQSTVAAASMAVQNQAVDDSYGPWMLVQKSRRNVCDNNKSKAENMGSVKEGVTAVQKVNKQVGSIFSILCNQEGINNDQERNNDVAIIESSQNPRQAHVDKEKFKEDKGKSIISGSQASKHKD